MKKLLYSGLFLFSMFAVIAFADRGSDSSEGGADHFRFHTPAYQGSKDVTDPTLQQKFLNAWDKYLNRFTNSASVYNLSGGMNHTAPGYWYVNPKKEKVPMDDTALQVAVSLGVLSRKVRV